MKQSNPFLKTQPLESIFLSLTSNPRPDLTRAKNLDPLFYPQKSLNFKILLKAFLTPCPLWIILQMKTLKKTWLLYLWEQVHAFLVSFAMDTCFKPY
jgi:hypothetical protein